MAGSLKESIDRLAERLKNLNQMSTSGKGGLGVNLERMGIRMDMMRMNRQQGGGPSGIGEALSNMNWSTRTQAGLHDLIGAKATRALKGGTKALGAGIQLGGQMLQGAGGAVDRGMKSDALGTLGQVGGGLNSAGDALIKTGNPYGVAAGAVLKFAGTVAQAPAKIKEWADHLHEANQQFAQFSGSMAAVMAQDEARRIQLMRDQGENRAESAKELSDARYRLDAALAPVEDTLAKFKNKVVAKLADAVGAMVETLTGGANAAGKGITENKTQGHQWLTDIDTEIQEINRRRPKRFR